MLVILAAEHSGHSKPEVAAPTWGQTVGQVVSASHGRPSHRAPSSKAKTAKGTRLTCNLIRIFREPTFNVHAPSSKQSLKSRVEKLMEAATVVDIDRIPAAAARLSYQVALLS